MHESRTLTQRRVPPRLHPFCALPQPTKALGVVRQWMNTSSPILVLSGGVGSGKTIAAAWAVGHTFGACMCRGMELGRLAPWDRPELAAEPERGWPRHDLVASSLLLIDDVGAEANPDRIRAVLQELLDARTDFNVRTILTTNLRVQDAGEKPPQGGEFRRAYGDPIWSRLLAGSVATISGEDLRPKKIEVPAAESAPSPESAPAPITDAEMAAAIENLPEAIRPIAAPNEDRKEAMVRRIGIALAEGMRRK